MAHESSVKSVNQAGQNFVASADNRQVANVVRSKLDDVNNKWAKLTRMSDGRQRELEGALGEVRKKLFERCNDDCGDSGSGDDGDGDGDRGDDGGSGVGGDGDTCSYDDSNDEHNSNM